MKSLLTSLFILVLLATTSCKKDNNSLDTSGNLNLEEDATSITIVNKSGKPVYIYDWDMSLDSAVAISPVSGGDPLGTMESGKGGTLSLILQKASRPNVAARRIYISKKELNQSLNNSDNPAMPDPFNYNVDATIEYSFVEYNYNDPSSSVSSKSYTIDLSYIDEYSYPLTLKFANTGDYNGCVEGHEYGLKSITDVKEELKSISRSEIDEKYAWDALIWLKVVKCEWNSEDYPEDMIRIIGPNKVWSEVSGSSITQPWVPDSYLPFVQSLPKTGNQLFGGDSSNTNNWTGWENWKQSHNPSPSNTGYVKALHAAANKDKNGKYGFFCYPNDNADGEFTYVPDSVNCTITVYSLTE